ncbi:hypothetical protein EGC79_20125 [Shewanella vesiculosa]|nr:hypothetical protein EGC79_20125 [Shewanella vesiculosa]
MTHFTFAWLRAYMFVGHVFLHDLDCDYSSRHLVDYKTFSDINWLINAIAKKRLFNGIAIKK